MWDAEALTVARILVNEFNSHMWVPNTIPTDQGRHFKSAIIKVVCQLLVGIRKTQTTPYHPQSDGMIEWLTELC